jgi:hypothetical protein
VTAIGLATTAAGEPARGTGVAITEIMRLAPISVPDLAMVTGGGDLPPSVIVPKSCTPSNPKGAPIYTQSMETDHSGPSMSQKVIDAYDHAMKPWTTLNSLAGPFASLAGAQTLRPAK